VIEVRKKAPLWDNDEIERRILHEGDDLIVFNKPYDWPTSGHNLDDMDCVQYHLIRYLREKGTITPTAKYPIGMVWAVHQLDADTTGLLLFATQKSSVHKYHHLLTHPNTEKYYIAVVRGRPEWNTIIETNPIGKRADGSRGVLTELEGGQSARTEFTVLERHHNHSVLKVRLHTGRTHQIRIHLSILRHPLLGEERYTPEPCQRHFRQALHAYSISIPNVPSAPIPEDLINLYSEKHT